jgi:hypothetical protein
MAEQQLMKHLGWEWKGLLGSLKSIKNENKKPAPNRKLA